MTPKVLPGHCAKRCPGESNLDFPNYIITHILSFVNMAYCTNLGL